MRIWTRIMLYVMCQCCKRLGWQIAVGKSDDGEHVTDIIVGPPNEVDRICAALEDKE